MKPRLPIVEYRGDSKQIAFGEHLREVTRLSVGETYGKHTVNQPSVVVDDVDEVKDHIQRYILPLGTVVRFTGHCICPACSQA